MSNFLGEVNAGVKLKKIAFLLTLFAMFFLQGQNRIKKSLVKPNASLIAIDSENCFKINLKTAATDVILVEAVMAGEYKNNLALTLRDVGTTVFIEAGFQPNFIVPNDKLSAHKIISIVLNILIPEHMNVKINGSSSNVFIHGNYKNLNVILGQGMCSLYEVSENISIKTQQGDIIGNVSSASIRAVSMYGVIKQEVIPKGKNSYDLKTISGDILLKKTE